MTFGSRRLDAGTLASSPNSLCVFAKWQPKTDSLAATFNCMFWLGSAPNIFFFLEDGNPCNNVSLDSTIVLAKWHLHLSNGLSSVHEFYGQTTDIQTTLKMCRVWLRFAKCKYRICYYASCLLDLCHSIGLRPPFSALRASTRPAASKKQRCSVAKRCRVAAMYNDAHDASPWWRRLCNVTANSSA